MTALAAIAVRTERIRIGSFVMLMPFQDPLRIAEDGACVDNWSNGRLELGVGQGYRIDNFPGSACPGLNGRRAWLKVLRWSIGCSRESD